MAASTKSPPHHRPLLSPKQQRLFIENCSRLVDNSLSSRAELLRRISGTDPRKDLDKECGYPEVITIEQYRDFYFRHPVGNRVVAHLPDECWSETPDIFEDEKPSFTPWEEELNALLEQHNLFHYWHRADELSRVGHFGVILVGIDDGLDLSKPAAGVEPDNKPNKKKSTPTEKRKLLYIRCFDESLVRISEYDTDTSSPRYGQPVFYQLKLFDPASYDAGAAVASMSTEMKTVHWTRIVHLADNRKSSEISGAPAQEIVFNALCDLKKVGGSSAEMFYKGGFPGYSFKVDPNQDDFEIDRDSLVQQMESYMNRLQRYISTVGVSVESLEPQVADPSNHIMAQLRLISVALACPLRILIGAEAAHLASTQDQDTWNRRIRRRQNSYLSPMLIRPFLDRLIAMGVLSPPAKPYTIKWPDLSAPNDMDKAKVAQIVVAAMVAYVSGGVDQIIEPIDFLTKVLWFSIEDASRILARAELFMEDGGLDTPEDIADPPDVRKTKPSDGIDPDKRPTAKKTVDDPKLKQGKKNAEK